MRWRSLLIGMLLITLHRGDGGEVTVAAAHITSLRNAAGALQSLMPGSRCVVGLDDGKQIGVLESCAEVGRRIEDAGH